MSMTEFEKPWPEEFEDYIADRLAIQEDAQVEIDECIANSDLHGAAMGSFKHALISFELGDRQTGHSYLFMATVLAEADVIYEAAAAVADPLYQEVNPQEILDRQPVLKVPLFLRARAISTPDLGDENDSKTAFEREVVDAVDALNTVHELKDKGIYDTVELNMAILRAVNTVGALLYERILKYENIGKKDLDPDLNIALLKLARETAAHAVVNEDLASTEIALEINEQLLLLASLSPRAVLSSLTQARRVFQDISMGPYAKSLGEKAKIRVDIYAASQAIKSYQRRALAMPFVLSVAAISQDYTIGHKEWPRLRPSNTIRHEAIEAYEEKLSEETRALLSDRAQS